MTGRPGYLPALARGKGVRCVFIFALQLPIGVIAPEICKPIIAGNYEQIYSRNHYRRRSFLIRRRERRNDQEHHNSIPGEGT